MNLADRLRPDAGRRVQLMATCLCDAFYDDAARATVEVLEHLGCTVEFPAAQTCCGQPAFNGGDWPASRRVVRHTVATFAGDCPVVVPSGSCAAMVFHGALLEFEHEADLPAVAALGRRTWELADFIVNGLGVTAWPGRYEATHRLPPLLPRARHAEQRGGRALARHSSPASRWRPLARASSAAASAAPFRSVSPTSPPAWAS